MIADCVSRTGFHTFSAADTLRMVWRVYYVDIHLADTAAFLAANTFLMINLDLKKRYLVKR